MLRSANDLRGFSIGATDGEIGQVVAYYFDDEQWTVRYIVVNAGGWFNARKLLVSPLSVDGADWNSRTFETALTREEVKNSPTIDTDGPISRRQEAAYNTHHKLSSYWKGPKLWGPAKLPSETHRRSRSDIESARAGDEAYSGSHVHSTKQIEGFRLGASDGEIGHVEDFIIDDETWTIRYIVVDTRNWWPGKKVTLSPRWVKSVDWKNRKVHVDLSRREIKNSPEYDDTATIDREYEERLHDHYGQSGYWNG
jgi:uncharacterized protein YrrD